MQSQHHPLIHQGPLNARAGVIHRRLHVGAALLFRLDWAIGVGGASRSRRQVLDQFAIAWLGAAIINLMHNNAEKSADKDGSKVEMRTEKAYLLLRRNSPCWQYRPGTRT